MFESETIIEEQEELILIDTHCHLNAVEPSSVSTLVNNAVSQNVKKMICVGAIEGLAGADKALKISEEYDNVWASVGIHPHDASEFTSPAKILKHFSHEKVVAVGETGLDFFKDWAPKDNQIVLFKNTIRLALELGKPLIIHCRDAYEECFKILNEEKAEVVGGVFHCYGHDLDFTKRLLDLNFLVSFPGTVTFKNASALREVVKRIPLTQMMLETDSPYMAPEPFRGKPSEPAHVRLIAEKIAEVKGLTLEEVAKVTTANAHKLFGLN
jgi:TatD DNase family protein